MGNCTGSGGANHRQQGTGEGSNGKIAFARTTEGSHPKSDIYVIDEEGAHESRLTHSARFEDYPVWSPDGQKIAFTTVWYPNDLYVMNADGTDQTRLAEAVSQGVYPAWSPDGQKIAFTRGQSDVYVIDADGSKESSLTTFSLGNADDRTQVGNPVWSPDGGKIAFASRTLTYTDPTSSAEPASAPAEGLTGIYLVNVDGTGLCKLTSTDPMFVLTFEGPVWSPDGGKIAFYHNGTINVINTDGSGRKQLIGGVTYPPDYAWSPDGQRIAFIDSSELYVINADGSGRKRLTKTPGGSSAAVPTWSPDGEKMAFSCPFEDLYDPHTDLCVVNADGSGLKRIASNAKYQGGRSQRHGARGRDDAPPGASTRGPEGGSLPSFDPYSPECVEG